MKEGQPDIPKKASQMRVGSATTNKITATKRKRLANLFATRFSPDLTCTDLESYLCDVSKIHTKCEKLESKHPDSYSSFYVRAECDDPEVFINQEIWPEGIYFRWFKPRKNHNTPSSGVQRNQQPLQPRGTTLRRSESIVEKPPKDT